MQHEALVGVKTDPERPALPAHRVAVDLEAGTVGLDDVERPQAVAHRANVAREVATAIGGQRHRSVILHLDDFPGTHVEERDKTFDRARVAVVGRRVAQVGDAARDPPTLLQIQPEVAGRPRVDLHTRRIVDAAPMQRRDPVRVLRELEDGLQRLAEHQCGTHAFVGSHLAHLTGAD